MASNLNQHARLVITKGILAVIAMVATGFLLIGCGGGNTDPAQGGNEPLNPLTPRGWELVWSDEFDGTSLDSSKWNIQTGDGTAEGIPGWGNNELQSYQAANISVGGGNLTITAREESADGRDYTSGRINTAEKMDFTYGRVEASVHAASGQGLWSAFWMLPTNSEYGTWAAGGEVDILEVFSRDPVPFTQAALHYGMAWPLNTFVYQKYEGVDPVDGFHVYAVEWDEQELRWFVDGAHYFTVNRSTYWNYFLNTETNAHEAGSDSAPFDRPFHLLLNLAVGGNLPGAPVASSFPGELRVDYVRVYKCNIDEATGRGCDGFIDYTDPSVVAQLPQKVFTASYDLYVDSAGPLTFPNTEDVVPLSIGVYDANGALVFSEVDSGSDRGMVIDMLTSGGGNFNIFPASNERQTLFGMGSASDPANYAGEVSFDLYVFSEGTDSASGVQVKLDSGFPDLGFVELPIADLPMDEWTTITVQISDIAHNAGNFGGGPVDLSNVLSLFVLEPTGAAHLQVDNIRLSCAHINQDDCGIAPPSPPPPPSNEPFLVYIDGVDPAWDRGVGASDSSTGWSDYFDGTTANKVQWREIDADDAARGKVLEVTFSDLDAQGVWFIQSSMAVDLAAYAGGTVSFDIKVDDYSSNEGGMTMKIDCFFPCTSGDQVIGKVGDGEWESVEIPVSRLLGGGLNLASVNTGIVIFPMDLSSPVTFQLDNVQWLPGDQDVMPPPPSVGTVTLFDDQLAEGWGLWDCCGGATFGEVEDETRGNVVELAFGATPTVAGFQAVDSVDILHLATGALEFDFKEVSPPPEGSSWLLKLESAGAATFAEVMLTHGGNPEPGPEWQRYRFSISEDLAGLDITALKLLMIFPNWGNADGAIGRIDNVRFVPERASLELYGDSPAEGWFLWDCCGAATFAEVEDDEEHGNVIELSFGAGGTVTGLQAAVGVDASSATGGKLVFEFKEVSPPPEGSVWRVKLESSDSAKASEVLMTDEGNPTPNAEWQSYSFDMETAFPAVDFADLKLVMFFPDWANAEGAVGRIDNVRLEAPE
ncbi:MAG: family 16 glycosylhydrolase [Gammaproteobacteria bacterium]|nr:family 16 glycosylhydrolase [Gammaproteobacteria bacterium]